MVDEALPQKVMIVDDSPVGLQEVKTFLEKQGIQTLTAPDHASALYLFNTNKVDVTVITIELKDASGLSLLQKIRDSGDDLTKKSSGVVMASGARQRTTAELNLLKEFGDIEVIVRPYKGLKLLPFLARAKRRSVMDMKFESIKSKVVNQHVAEGNYAKAIQAVEAILPQIGKRGDMLMLDLLEKANEYQRALAQADGILEKSNDNITALNAKGRIHMKMGDLEKARIFMEKADKLAPKNLTRLHEMAQLYLELREPENSIEKMTDIIGESPEKPDIKFEMYQELIDSGFAEEAINFCRSTASPIEVVRFYNNHGVMKSKSGEFADAETKYNEALRFFPKNKENYRIYFNLALVLINSRQPGFRENAEKALATSLELNPTFEKAQALMLKLQKLAIIPPAKPAGAKKKTASADSQAALKSTGKNSQGHPKSAKPKTKFGQLPKKKVAPPGAA